MLKSLLKDTVIYTIPVFISKGINFFLLPFYTRVITPSEYGNLDIIILIAAFVNLLITLELNQGVARFIGEKDDENYKSQVSSICLVFTLVAYLLFTVTSFLFRETLSPLIIDSEKSQMIFTIGLAYLFANGLFYLFVNQLKWEFKTKQFATTHITLSVLTSVFAVIFLLYFDMGVSGILLAMFLANAIAATYAFLVLRKRYRFELKSELFNKMIRFSAPLVPSSIALYLLLYMDRLMIDQYMTKADLGYFGVAFRIANVSALVMVGFRSSISPFIYKNYKDEKTPLVLSKVFNLFVAISVVFIATFHVFGNEILSLLVSKEYYGVYSSTLILIPALLISQLYIFTPGIELAKKTYINIWINSATVIVNVILNLTLIPKLGLEGAALATLLSNIALFACRLHLSQGYYFIPFNLSKILVVLLAVACLLAIFQIYIHDLNYLMKIATVFLIITSLLVFKLISVSEIQALLTQIRRK